MKKDAKFDWKEELKKALQELKWKIMKEKVLPKYYKRARTKIITDASLVGLRAALIRSVVEVYQTWKKGTLKQKKRD